MTGNEALQTLLQQQDGRHLGDFIGWSFSGTVSQRVAREEAEDHGLADDLKFPRANENSAYRTAVRKAVTGRVDDRRYSVVRLHDDPEQIVHAIARQEVVTRAVHAQHVTRTDNEFVTHKDIDFKVEARVRFDKEARAAGKPAEALLDIDDPSHPVAALVRQHYYELCVVYTPDQIRSATQRAFTGWDGGRVLGNGGLWYVPSTHVDQVRAWVGWMDDVKQESLVIPVFDTTETVAALRKITRNNLDGQLQEIRDDLKRFADGGNRTRVSSLERRVEMFDTLRARADLYERLLGTEIEDLKQEAQKAQAALVQAIMQVKQ
jgi:hypothetical protein